MKYDDCFKIYAAFSLKISFAVAVRSERRYWKWNNSNTRSVITNKISRNEDITNRNTEERLTNTRSWQHRKTDYFSVSLLRKNYIWKELVECELTAHYHMQEYWGKNGIIPVWACTKIISNE
jgi:hypothetical protein